MEELTVELSGFDKNCIELLDTAPKRRSRHCFKSALYNLELADKILSIDPGMAIFRCITAEEEAATGLMYCLKERGYKNAEKLKPKDHVHKNSAIPFISILFSFYGSFIKENQLQNPVLHIQNQDGNKRLTLGFPLFINGESHNAYPIPPLNFLFSVGNKSPSYKKQISDHIKDAEAKDITTHLKQVANSRNELLYASDDGYPIVSELQPEFIELRYRKVLTLLRAYLFIFPYAEQQPFVQDALDAYLAMLGKLPDHNLHDEV
jgi:hypothetical protein